MFTTSINYKWTHSHYATDFYVLESNPGVSFLVGCFILKGTVQPQIIILKYVMLITINQNLTIIITNYTRYHKYKEIIHWRTAITAAPDARFDGGKAKIILNGLYRLPVKFLVSSDVSILELPVCVLLQNGWVIWVIVFTF